MRISIFMKHNDMTSITVSDNDKVVAEGDGYMPYLNSHLGGDDTQMTIDNETGKIIGWEPITIEDLFRAKEEGQIRFINDDE